MYETSSDREKFKKHIKGHLCELQEVLEPEELVVQLLTKNCITLGQKEQICSTEQNKGKQAAALFLLTDVFPRSEGWYDLLLDWLLSRGHEGLVAKIDSEYLKRTNALNNLPQSHLLGAVGGRGANLPEGNEGDFTVSSSESIQSELSTIYNVLEEESSATESSQYRNGHQLDGQSENKTGRRTVPAADDNNRGLVLKRTCSVMPSPKMPSGVEGNMSSDETPPKKTFDMPVAAQSVQGSIAPDAESLRQRSSIHHFYVPQHQQMMPVQNNERSDQPSTTPPCPVAGTQWNIQQNLPPLLSQLFPSLSSSASPLSASSSSPAGGYTINQDGASCQALNQQNDLTTSNDRVAPRPTMSDRPSQLPDDNNREEYLESNLSLLYTAGIATCVSLLGIMLYRSLK